MAGNFGVPKTGLRINSMNIILIDSEEIGEDGLVVLNDRRSEHIINVLRSECGDRVKIGVVDGSLGSGLITAIESFKKSGRVVLDVSLDGHLPELPGVDLILAVPRPIMLKRVLVQAVSLGVGRIFLINANKVEKSYFDASLFKGDNIRNQLLLGLEQAMDTRIPEVSVHKRFRPFVEDLLPEIIDNYPSRFIAHPTASKFIYEFSPSPIQGPRLLAIGPEGGWVHFELEKFQGMGFEPVTLGPRILRVDTAVPALLAQVNLLCLMNR